MPVLQFVFLSLTLQQLCLVSYFLATSHVQIFFQLPCVTIVPIIPFQLVL